MANSSSSSGASGPSKAEASENASGSSGASSASGTSGSSGASASSGASSASGASASSGASGASGASSASGASGSSGASSASGASGSSGPSAPDPVCFARDTLIFTEQGEIPVQDLAAGDRVWTESRGFQPLRWICAREVLAIGDFAPIKIKAGALGCLKDLWVSPQHRLLVSGPHVELLFGVEKALVAAKDLINDQDIRRDLSMKTVEYFHILFDRHEIVKAHGVLSESYFPIAENADAFSKPQRREFLALFADFVAGAGGCHVAYPALLPHEVALLRP